MQKTHLVRSGILVLLFTLFAAQTLALSIGVTPANINIDQVKRGGYAERVIFVTTGESETVQGHIEPSGIFREWVYFVNGSREFTLEPQENVPLTLIIEPPTDLPSGNYTGHVDVVTDAIGSIEGRAGGLALSSVRIILKIEVIGDEIIDCNAGGLFVRDLEEGSPLELSGRVVNTGNVRVTPQGSVEVWNALGTERISELTFRTQTVKPTTDETFNIVLGALNLDRGEHQAIIRVPECDSVVESRFTVYEEGAIVDQGELSTVKSSLWSLAGEQVPVTAEFVNTGPRTVLAKFKGVVSYDGNYVQELESDEIQVSPGSTEEFILFFEPQFEGRYVISGRVLFNSKTTRELGTILNVTTEEQAESSNLRLFIYIALILAIIYLLRKILKKKRRGA